MKLILAAVLTLLLESLSPALGIAQEKTPSDEAPAAATAEQEPLRVLVSSVEPFLYENESGEPAGLEYDILHSFAESQGRRMEMIPVETFIGVMERLRQGKGDLAAAVLTITEERRKVLDFSEPYFPALTMIVERRGKESASFEDLAGKRIAVRRKSSNERLVREIPGIEIVYADSLEHSFDLLLEGEADGVTTDSALYLWMADQYPDLAPSLTLSQRDFYGFALPKDSALTALLDAHISTLKRDGRYREYLYRAFDQWGVDAIDEMAEGLFEDEQ